MGGLLRLEGAGTMGRNRSKNPLLLDEHGGWNDEHGGWNDGKESFEEPIEEPKKNRRGVCGILG